MSIVIPRYQQICTTIARIAGVVLGFAIPISNTLTTIMVIILIFAWLGSGIRTHIKILLTHKVTLAILLLLACYVVGASYSCADFVTILLLLKKMARLLLIPILLTLFTEVKWRNACFYSFWLAVIFSLTIIVAKFWITPTILYNYFAKYNLASSWLQYNNVAFKDRIFTSMFFGFAGFSLLQYIVSANIETNLASVKHSINSLTFKIIADILGIGCLFYLYAYCDGRSGHIVGLLLFSILLLQNKITILQRLIMGVCFIVLCCGSWYFSAPIRERYQQSMLETNDFFSINSPANASMIATAPIAASTLLPLYYQSTGLRLEFWKNSLKIAATAPIFGYGTGAFRVIYNQLYPLFNENTKYQYMVHNPHNQYLLTLVELGLCGLGCLLWLFLTILLASIKLPRLERNLLQGALCTITVGCLFNSWLMDFTSMHYFVYFVGVLLGAMASNTNNSVKYHSKKADLFEINIV